jgi:hypothetical protein
LEFSIIFATIFFANVEIILIDRSKHTVKEINNALAINDVSLANLTYKVDIMLRDKLFVDWSIFPISLVAAVFGSSLFIFLFIAALNLIPRSFINLNDYSVRKYEEYILRRKIVYSVILGGLAIGFVSSLFASKIYSLLSG